MKLCALISTVAVATIENWRLHIFQAKDHELQRFNVHVCFDSVKQRSREGLEAARMELEDREKVGEKLHRVQDWLQAADDLLSEMEQSSSTQELQVGHYSTLDRLKPLNHGCIHFQVKHEEFFGVLSYWCLYTYLTEFYKDKQNFFTFTPKCCNPHNATMQHFAIFYSLQ